MTCCRGQVERTTADVGGERLSLVLWRRLSLCVPVPVPMVQVGEMRVPMHHRLVPMRMGMRLTGVDARCMIMPMVLVMTMTVLVLQQFVDMLVLVPLRQMQLQSDAHQASRCQQRYRDRLAQHCHGQRRADERCE